MRVGVRRKAITMILALLCVVCLAVSPSARPQTATQSPFQPPVAQSNSPSSHTEAKKPAKPRKPLHREAYQRKSLVDVSNAQRVNVAQLEEALRESHGHSDRQIAKQLELLGLTQRFTRQNLLRWQSKLPGNRSRKALGLLADASSFLPLPPTEKLILPDPSPRQELQMIDRVVRFVADALLQQPQVVARQSMERYLEVDPEYASRTTKPIWRHIGSHHGKVYMLDGGVSLRPYKPETAPQRNAITPGGDGSYGQMLGTVLHDIRHGSLMWSHWEQSPRGPIAVIAYRVPQKHSHYEATFTNISRAGRKRITLRAIAYHGELSFDPATGAPVRLALEGDLNPRLAFRRSDVVIDYEQFHIGSQEFIFPAHTVDIVRRWFPGYDENGNYYEYADEATVLTSISFSQYRLH